MSFIYYAAGIPGTQDIAGEITGKRLPDLVIHKVLDGALLFETRCPYDQLNLFCFNNIFSVLDIFENPPGAGALTEHVKKILGQKNFALDRSGNRKQRTTFRVIFSQANRLVPVDEKLRRGIERLVAGKTGLVPCPGGADTEYWFLSRSEGFSVFMERRSKHRPFDKTLHRGELSPPLAYLLCWLSRPSGTDVVLDPFCGYGSIPEQRLKRFPLSKCWALDRRDEALDTARKKIPPGRRSLCEIKAVEFGQIFSVIPPGSVDKIITDPPWGLYEKTALPLEDFYAGMLETFRRLLRAGGRAVILTAGKEELKGAAARTGGLILSAEADILVSGRKAGIFTLEAPVDRFG
jgi:hypothetical protein